MADEAREFSSTEGVEAASPVTGSMVVPANRGRALQRGNASEGFVRCLSELGVRHAFGLFGGGIGPFCRALAESPIRLMHFKHEAGAAFAAVEASLASGRLVVVAVTTGPGLSNLYTGMLSAKQEGGRVLFVSGHTATDRRGRFAFQETSSYAPSASGLFEAGSVLDHGAVIEDASQLAHSVAVLTRWASRPQGVVAHLGIPLAVQSSPLTEPLVAPTIRSSVPSCDSATAKECLELLSRGSCVIWAGYGARHASEELTLLAELSGSRVMASPRA